MHAILKKVNYKFVIEWNKDKKPLETFIKNIPDCHNLEYLVKNKKWQQNTKVIDFASESEVYNILDYLCIGKLNNKAFDNDIKGINVFDCVEVKWDCEYLNIECSCANQKCSNGGYKAYFKHPKEVFEIDINKLENIIEKEPSKWKENFESRIENKKDKLLNTFANHCLQQGITFKHSNQISEVVTNFLKQNKYENKKNNTN